MKKLKYGNTNIYFINGLLFDTDMPGTLQSFYKVLKQNDLSIHDIHYVLCSHYHPDHMGLVSELMKLGIKLVIVEHQLPFIHFSDEIFRKQLGDKYILIDEKQARIISINESRTFLKSVGIDGEIISTTSHSKDGIVLILDNGECFVGDLEPYSYIKAYEKNVELEKDWEHVLSYQPKVVYFGHVNDMNIYKK